MSRTSEVFRDYLNKEKRNSRGFDGLIMVEAAL
jgi:hypothetical protein